VPPFAGARVELARMPDRVLRGDGRLLEVPAPGGKGRARVEVTGPGTRIAGEVPFTLCDAVSAPVPSSAFVEQRVSLPGPPAPFDVRVGVPAGWTARPGIVPGETMWFAEDGESRFTVTAALATDAPGLEAEIAAAHQPAGGATSEVLRRVTFDDGVGVVWLGGGAAFPEVLHVDVVRWGGVLPAPVRCSLQTERYFPELAEAALVACVVSLE